MGLLDDAIKQHLELKRLRGADPNEISRQEHEALDPPGTQPIGGLDATPVHEPETAAHPAPQTPAPEPIAAEPAAEPVAAPVAYEPPPEAPAPPRTPIDPADLRAEPHHEAQPVADPPTAEEFDMGVAPPVDSALVHQPTAEYALEDLEALRSHPEPAAEDPDDEVLSAAEADADVADEDVLEETPEFLQETPEHDRLWFEQKPPRDFDF